MIATKEPRLPFSDFSLSDALLRAIAGMGCVEPFPIQSAVIPRVLAGRDLCVSARTGSGKTIAFAAPLIEGLGKSPARGHGSGMVRVLVLTPTRELAAQVGGVFRELARGAASRLVVRVVHGGGSINPDMLSLRGGADVLVATPGRLLDLASRNAARLGAVECLVLDEADRILGLGFREELAAILALLPSDRQTLLFSATIDSEIEVIARATLRDGERIALGAEAAPTIAALSGSDALFARTASPKARAMNAAAPEALASDAGLRELAYGVLRDDKGPFLRRFIESQPGFERILVFASSTRRADNVARKLVNHGIAAAAFHGDMSQAARGKALEDFKRGVLRVLVASDLASRGLDIEGLPCVVNYELPRQPLDYVHRIGRTGRAGAPGLAVSLVAPDEEESLRLIEKRIGRKLPRGGS